MGETVTVRLFVSTQTYDIPCDPRQPAKWLLMQAKNIQRSNRTPSKQAEQIHDELEVLYNRTQRIVLDLEEPIGDSIAPMDVIDARTLLQTPDTTSNSAMFPWLRTYPGGLSMSENMDSSNGLFFQQLYAYTLIGRRSPHLTAQRREQKKKDDFLDLLRGYMLGTYPESYEGNGFEPSSMAAPRSQPSNHYARPMTPQPPSVSVTPSTQAARRSTERPSTAGGFFSSRDRQVEYPNDRGSDSGSDEVDEALASEKPRSRAVAPPAAPSLPPRTPSTVPVRRATTAGNPLDRMENVFDIVFKQQAIGMKLGSDETKQYAVVKECFEGSEARRYPEIQAGVVILAVNGQEVNGLGLSRVLYRLREAPRPVVVRFGRITPAQHHYGAGQQNPRMGTWG